MNTMQNKKVCQKAFTIPELLIVLGIVGVVSVLMMTIIKPSEKYLPYAYYNAYNTLSTAAFNVKEDANGNNMSGDENISDVDKHFPGASEDPNTDGVTSAKELCKKLANNPDASDEDDKYGYINTTEYACTDTAFKSFASDGDFDTINAKPAFRATNSMKFYIGKLAKMTVPNALESNANYVIKYFIVWVDLNGDRNPNIAEWNKNKPSDIVPFVVTTSGEVIPIGAPTIDTRYTTVRIKYPSDSSLKYSPKSMNFLEGQIAAYDKKEFPSYDPLSLSNSLYNSFKKKTAYKNTADIITLINNKAQLDEKCKFNDGDAPDCTILVDENTRL